MSCPDEQIVNENRIEKTREVTLSTVLVTDKSISEEELNFEDASGTSYRKGEFI